MINAALKDRVQGLNDRLKSIQAKEADITMERGKFDEELKALVAEVTGRKDGQVNLAEILHGVLISASQ